MVYYRPIRFTPAAIPTQTRYMPSGAIIRPISYAAPTDVTTRPAGLTQPAGAQIAPSQPLTQEIIAARAQDAVNRYPSAPFRTYEVQGGYWYGVSTVDGMETRTKLNVATADTRPDPNARYRATSGSPTFSEGSAGWSKVAPSARPTAPGPGATKKEIFAYAEAQASWEKETMWQSIPESATWNDVTDWYGSVSLPSAERRQWEIGQSLLPSMPGQKALAIEQQYAKQKGMIISSSGNLTPTGSGGYMDTSGKLFIPTSAQQEKASLLPSLPSLPDTSALPVQPGLIAGIARAKLGQDYIKGGGIFPTAKQPEKAFNAGGMLNAPDTTTATTAGAPNWGMKPEIGGYLTYPIFAGTMMSLEAIGGFFDSIKKGIDTQAAKIPIAGPGVSAAGHFGADFTRVLPEGVMSSALLLPAAEFAIRQPKGFVSSILPGSAMMVSASIEYAQKDPWGAAGAVAGLIYGPKLIGKGYTALRSRAVEFNIWRQVPGEHRPTVRATSTIGRYVKGIESPVKTEPRLADVVNIKEGAATHIRNVLAEETHSLFGTVTTYGQMETPYRLTKDLDIIAANPKRMQTRLYEGIGGGYKKSGTGIVMKLGGKKTAHALDIRAPPTADYPVKAVKTLRVVYEEPVASYPFDYTPKELLKTGPITQEHLYTQAQRKATSTLGAPEKGGGWRFGPEGHRMKDIYDLVQTTEYLTAEEKARTSPLLNPIRRYKVWRLEQALSVIRQDPMVSGVLEEFTIGGKAGRTKTLPALRFDVGEPPRARTSYAEQARRYGRRAARLNIAELEAPGEEFTVRISPSPSVKKGLGPMLETLTRTSVKSYIPKSKAAGALDTILPAYYPTGAGEKAYSFFGITTKPSYPPAGGRQADVSYLIEGYTPKDKGHIFTGKEGDTFTPSKEPYRMPTIKVPGYSITGGGKGYSLIGTTKQYAYGIPTGKERYEHPGRSYGFSTKTKTYKYSPAGLPSIPSEVTRTKTGTSFIETGMKRIVPFKTTGWFTVPLTRKTIPFLKEEEKHKKKLRLHFDVRGSKWIIKNPIPRPEVVLGGEKGKQYKNELRIYDKQYSKQSYTVHMPFDVITDYKVTKKLRF